jgi:hypothetical protein
MPQNNKVGHPHRSTTHLERFVHIRPEHGLNDKYASATIFARQEQDGKWYAARALCWNIDQFNKETGRKNARRHYFEHKALRYQLGSEFKITPTIQLVLADFKEQVSIKY